MSRGRPGRSGGLAPSLARGVCGNQRARSPESFMSLRIRCPDDGRNEDPRAGGASGALRRGRAPVLRRRRGRSASCSCTGSAVRPRTGSRWSPRSAGRFRVARARPARPRRLRAAAPPDAGMTDFADVVAAPDRARGRAARRSSPATRSAGSSRCGLRTGGPTSCAGCCSPRRRGSPPGRGPPSVRSCSPASCGRPAGWRRFAIATRERPWYRRALFQPWFVADPLALSPRADARLPRGPARARRHAHGGARRCWPTTRGSDLEHVRCPSLVLWGARDPQLPLDDAFEYARRLRARLRVVADCGHLVIGERPEACLDALESLARA